MVNDSRNPNARPGVYPPMKAAILVCILAGTVWAAPRHKRASALDPKLSEHVRLAEQAWAAAETERDPANQVTRWEAVANAFALVDGDPVDVNVKRAAAYSSIVAWRNAIDSDPTVADALPTSSREIPPPRRMPAREQRLIAAIDRYASYTTGPSDAELPAVLFVKARTYAQFDQLETAIPIYRGLIERYPRDEVGLFSANMLLDAYNRLHQYDKLVALADELANNKAFLQDRDDLAALVKRIQKEAKRSAIERLEAQARDTKDPQKYVAAGTAYMDLYNADPRNPAGDELLYNAAVTFQEGGAIAAAIQALGLIEKNYPNSKLGPRALARLGKMYGDIAMYDKAAERLEQYAKKYAGEKDAYDAMSDAIYYRKALGDRAKAIEDTKYFVRTFGAKKPRDAADAMWSLTALYEPTAQLAISHLREYIRTYGSRGGAERLVVAHAKIGLLLWKQSCKVAGLDGLCVKHTAKAARTCGKGTTGALSSVQRDARTTKEALVSLTAAIREYERQHAPPDATARYYYAQAKLAAADLDLERYLTISFPGGLDFDPSSPETRTASMKRFSSWLTEKQTSGASARRRYDDVLTIKDAASSITAVERQGVIAHTFANTLISGELPRDITGADATNAYCDAMTAAAEPLEAASVAAFGVCLAKSTELGWFSESSAHCERELTRLEPEEFPAMRELRAQAEHDALVVVAEPPLR
jgi:outer membrane protein assembly factor BamD (BamD/ComL family)